MIHVVLLFKEIKEKFGEMGNRKINKNKEMTIVKKIDKSQTCDTFEHSSMSY